MPYIGLFSSIGCTTVQLSGKNVTRVRSSASWSYLRDRALDAAEQHLRLELDELIAARVGDAEHERRARPR